MKKVLALILSLLMVLSLFSACGKDNKTEDSKKESTTSQTTETKTEDATETEKTSETEASSESQDKSEVKKPTEDKNKPADKTQNKDKDKTEDKENNKGNNNSKPSQGSNNTIPSLKVANTDLLLGSWTATFVTNGVTAKLYFTFDIIDSVVRVRFSKENYENMIKQIVEKEMSKITDEDIAESEDFSSREEAEEYMYDYITQEIPYSSMSSQLNGTGSWKLHGDTLTINLGGETYTAETRLSEDITTFVLVGPSGERMTLNKW